MSQDNEVIAFLLELVRDLREQNKAMSGELIMRSSGKAASPKFVKDGKTLEELELERLVELERLERLRAARTGLGQTACLNSEEGKME